LGVHRRAFPLALTALAATAVPPLSPNAVIAAKFGLPLRWRWQILLLLLLRFFVKVQCRPDNKSTVVLFVLVLNDGDGGLLSFILAVARTPFDFL